MHKTIKYFDNWKDEPLHCPNCQWGGTCETASEDDYSTGQVFCCPQCSESVLLLVVPFPTTQENRAHWDQLDQNEKRSLVKREAFLTDYESRKLKSSEQLPDIEQQIFIVQWNEQETETGVDVVLCVGSEIIHAEPRTWEAAHRFGEIAKILHQRYGHRIQDLIPTPRSYLYLYGDDTGAVEYVAARRAELSFGK